jgi:hypothetical protein
MFSEVLAFAIIMTVFEFVIVSMLPPRLRLRLLGNHGMKVACHMIMLLINITVHWGTVVGTMSSTLSFLTSIVAMAMACKLYGKLVDGRYYHVGLVKYSIGEIK